MTLADNASIHKTQGSLETLERVTQGRYKFVAAYSHFLSPIERGFANVLREARLYEEEGMRNPEAVLHRAFMKYSVAGTHGHVGTCHGSVSDIVHGLIWSSDVFRLLGSSWSLRRVRTQPREFMCENRSGSGRFGLR